MTRKNPARGSATRTANMNKRREQILTCAGNIIASEGVEAFTLHRLAQEAEVTVPTIHNLIGKKSDVVKRLVDETLIRVEEAFNDQVMSDPITAVETFIDQLMDLFSSNEDLYRAAFIAGEQAKLFEHVKPTGIFSKSLQLTIQVIEHAQAEGYLEGRINTHRLAQEIFGCQRLARHDWMHGYIDLDTYRNQVLVGMFILFAADAAPEFRNTLLQRVEEIR
jgi:AcrR family transcriptional regulator